MSTYKHFMAHRNKQFIPCHYYPVMSHILHFKGYWKTEKYHYVQLRIKVDNLLFEF